MRQVPHRKPWSLGRLRIFFLGYRRSEIDVRNTCDNIAYRLHAATEYVDRSSAPLLSASWLHGPGVDLTWVLTVHCGRLYRFPMRESRLEAKSCRLSVMHTHAAGLRHGANGSPTGLRWCAILHLCDPSRRASFDTISLTTQNTKNKRSNGASP